MRAIGSSFDETVLGWNINEEFVFRIDRCSLPAMTGFAERWRMRALDGESTELTWSTSVDPAGPAPIVRASWSLVTGVLIGPTVRRLGKFIGAHGRIPDGRT